MKINEYLFYKNSIPIGKENAISKEQLCRKWGMSERRVRLIIKELQEDIFLYEENPKYQIVSFSSSKGFYRTDKVEDIKHVKNECRKRGDSLYHKAIIMEKLEEIFGKGEMKNG